MRLALVLASISAVSANSAHAASPATTRCVRIQDIANPTVGDDHTRYLSVGGKSVYRVEMHNNCLGGSSSSDAIVLTGCGSSSICQAIDLDISAMANGGGLPSRCIVDTLTQLTPAQITARPKKVRP